MDTLTILGCPSNRRAAKIHLKTANDIKTEGYSAGRMFQCKVATISNIMELGSVLTQIERLPNLLAIRGDPKPDLDCQIWHRRTKHNPPNYQSPATGHHHVMVDIDKLPLPSGLNLATETIPQVLEFVAKQLPEEFHRCSFYWQLPERMDHPKPQVPPGTGSTTSCHRSATTRAVKDSTDQSSAPSPAMSPVVFPGREDAQPTVSGKSFRSPHPIGRIRP